VSVPETSRGERRRDVQQRRGSSQSHREGQHRGNGDSRRVVQHRRAIVTPMVRESVIVIGLALLLSLLVKTWLMQAFYIPSGSMEPTLHGCPGCVGDRVLVNKMVPTPISLRRGDIIVFEDPDHWLPAPILPQRSRLSSAVNSTLTFIGLLASDEGNHLIKRVIGLPGDHVVCCDVRKRLTVNGVPLNEPYIFPGDTPSQATFDIIVPAGKVWVMGDHRSDSGDSRPHDLNTGGAKGSVPENLIVGRAVTVVWPFARWAWLSNPSQTFAAVPSATVR
jgi:signal peptidase I